MLRIEIVDAVHSRISNKDAKQIEPCISYPTSYWRSTTVGHNKRTGQPIKRRVRHDYTKNAFLLRENGYAYFYTGLIPRIADYCADNNLYFQVIQGENCQYGTDMDPYGAELPHITLRVDQFELIERATKRHRGILQAPTGTGKTVLQMALRSCYRDKKTLILAHTKSIVQQTFSELIKFGFKNVQIIGAGHSHDCGLWGETVVATMQSFIKIPMEGRADYFEVVMVDEAHHVVRPDGVYAQILSTMLSPIRLGFTATVPTKIESLLTMEGLLGPVIAEQTIEEAAKLEILARPTISLLVPQRSQIVRDLRKYADVYNAGIVENRQRNRLIAEEAKKYVDAGKTVLILVTRLEHGDNLQTILEEHLDVPTDFVEGKTDSDMREQIKTAMIEKEQKCVIATAVWREGINIPSLDVVINACGGKSEIMTLQAIGRGLRKTDDKDEVIIVDLIDRAKYLSEHYAERMSIYHEQGWI